MGICDNFSKQFSFHFILFSPHRDTLYPGSFRAQLSPASGQPSHSSVKMSLAPLYKGVNILLRPHSPLYTHLWTLSVKERSIIEGLVCDSHSFATETSSGSKRSRVETGVSQEGLRPGLGIFHWAHCPATSLSCPEVVHKRVWASRRPTAA